MANAQDSTHSGDFECGHTSSGDPHLRQRGWQGLPLGALDLRVQHFRGLSSNRRSKRRLSRCGSSPPRCPLRCLAGRCGLARPENRALGGFSGLGMLGGAYTSRQSGHRLRGVDRAEDTGPSTTWRWHLGSLCSDCRGTRSCHRWPNLPQV